jgi:hypothetical protein
VNLREAHAHAERVAAQPNINEASLAAHLVEAVDYFARIAAGNRDTTSDTQRLIMAIIRRLDTMSATLDTELSALKASVEQEGDQVTAAVTLLSGLSNQLSAALAAAKANGATDAQLANVDSIVASIQAQTQALASAITANTPAATAPVSGSDSPAGGGSDTVAAGSGSDTVAPATGADSPSPATEA